MRFKLWRLLCGVVVLQLWSPVLASPDTTLIDTLEEAGMQVQLAPSRFLGKEIPFLAVEADPADVDTLRRFASAIADAAGGRTVLEGRARVRSAGGRSVIVELVWAADEVGDRLRPANAPYVIIATQVLGARTVTRTAGGFGAAYAIGNSETTSADARVDANVPWGQECSAAAIAGNQIIGDPAPAKSANAFSSTGVAFAQGGAGTADRTGGNADAEGSMRAVAVAGRGGDQRGHGGRATANSAFDARANGGDGGVDSTGTASVGASGGLAWAKAQGLGGTSHAVGGDGGNCPAEGGPGGAATATNPVRPLRGKAEATGGGGGMGVRGGIGGAATATSSALALANGGDGGLGVFGGVGGTAEAGAVGNAQAKGGAGHSAGLPNGAGGSGGHAFGRVLIGPVHALGGAGGDGFPASPVSAGGNGGDAWVEPGWSTESRVEPGPGGSGNPAGEAGVVRDWR